MYEAFYGLHERPFALSPDPKYLFLSESHREVLGHLIYGIEQGEGFIAISGEVGTGKTTLCRTLLQRLGQESEVAFLFNPNLTPLELVKAINAEFGLSTFGDSMPELLEVLNGFLLDKKAEDRRVLIIVDEAQNLSKETLEQIRMLSNLETETSKLIQIVLLGQPELDEKLSDPELRQLRQRISVWWHLGPLAAGETRDYVRHRLRIAGAERLLFSDAALALVHRRSGGVPRLVNILCDRALLAGYGEEVGTIDRRLVAEVVREIRLGSSRRRGSWRPRLPALGRPRLPRGAGWVAAAVAVVGAGILVGLLAGRGDRAPSPAAPVGVDAPPPARPPLAAARPDPAVLEALAREEGPEPEAELFDDPWTVLDTLLPRRTPEEATSAALDAALSAWGLEPLGAESLASEEADAMLAGRGLRRLTLEAGDLDALRDLDVPALVPLAAPDGEPRLALVRRVTATHADLEGLVEGQLVRIPLSELEARWSGDGTALWRDYEGLPDRVHEGDSGPAVIWLQSSLARLGHYDGAAPGLFDAETSVALRRFQESNGLPADGGIDAATKIRLYASLPGYAPPRLDVDAR